MPDLATSPARAVLPGAALCASNPAESRAVVARAYSFPTLRTGMPGTKTLVARYGERLVCARYLYDETRSQRLKTVELVIEEVRWSERARKPRRNDHDLARPVVAVNGPPCTVAESVFDEYDMQGCSVTPDFGAS